MRDSRLVDLTWQVYRLLLVFYPGSYRREFGREMTLAFRDYCRWTVSRKGVLGLFQIWLTMGVDLFATALVERLTEVKEMSTRSSARLLGTIGSLGGVLLVVIGYVWFTAGPNAVFALPVSPFYGLAIAAGCLGLFLSSENLGPNTKVGAAIAFFGMAFSALGLVLMAWLKMDIGWPLWFIGGIIIYPIGLILVGLTVHNLPAFWKAAPIAIGALTIVLSCAESQLDSRPLFGVWLLVFGLGWIVIGQMPSLARVEARV